MKAVKDKWLGARVDGPTDARVKKYTDDADMDMGELVRKGVDEYMINHPVKDPAKKANVNEVTKPGEE